MASINRLSPILAISVGVLHAGLSPVLLVGDVKPNIVLVAVAMVTARHGLRSGATWAFVGGLTANLFSTEPLGAIPLTLLLAAGVTAAGSRVFAGSGILYPVAAVAVTSVLADAGALLLDRLVVGGDGRGLPLEIIARAAGLNAALAAVTLGMARMRERRGRAAAPGVVARWPT